MDEFLIQHIILQIFLSLPLIFVFWRWRKGKWALKLLLVLVFLFTLSNLRDTIFHQPVNYKLDLSSIEEGETYDFYIYPGVVSTREAPSDFFISFDIVSDTPDGFIDERGPNADYINPWPSEYDNAVEFSIDKGDVFYDKLKNYNICCRGKYSYGTYVNFYKPFEKVKVTYKINKLPPENIKSITLNLNLLYFNDVGIGFFIGNVVSSVLVYGAFILYFLITWLYKKIKMIVIRKNNHKEGEEIQ